MQSFEEAVDKVKNLKETPSDNDLLELYGYYKQATVGDVNTGKCHWWLRCSSVEQSFKYTAYS